MRNRPLLHATAWLALATAGLLAAIAAAPATGPAAGPVVTLAPPAAATIVCGTGAPAPLAYTTGPTGVAWLSTSAVAPTRGIGRQWHTHAGYAAWPDPRHRADPAAYPAATVDPDNCLSVETVAVVYDAPGTYAATVDVTPWDEPTNMPTGPAVTYAQAVVRPVDARPTFYFAANGNDANAGTAAAPLKTEAKLAQVAARPGVRVAIVAPDVLDWTVGVSPGSGTTVEGLPAADGTLPVAHLVGPTTAFGIGGSASDVLVRRLRFTADGTAAAAGGVTVAPSGDHGARAQVANVWGSGVLFDQCEFGCLVQIVQQWAGDGLAVTRSAQLDPLSIAGQGLSSWGGTRPLFAFDVLTGETVDAPMRLDGVGTGAGLGVACCYLAQTNPAATGGSDKAALDVRSARRFVVAGNAAVNAAISLSDSHGSAGCADGLLTGNVYRSADGVHPAALSVVGKVSSLAVSGEDFGGCPGAKYAAVTIATHPAQSDLTVGANTVAPGLNPLSAPGVPASALTTGGR